MSSMANTLITKMAVTVYVLLFLLISAGCERELEIRPSGEVIKLGVIGPFSGDEKAKGLGGTEGIKTAMQVAPLLGNGDKIELVIEDDQNQPEQTVSALKKLANEDKVSAVLLMSTSASALAVRSLADNIKIPVLAMLATHPDITLGNNYISQLVFDDTSQGTVAALFVMDELLLERAAVFTSPDSQHSTALTAEFIRKFQSVGGVVTDTVLLGEGHDYVDKLMELRDKKTDLLYLPVKARELIAIEKATREIDWNPEIMASDGLLATVINDYSKEVALLEGIYAIDFFASDDKSLKRSTQTRKLAKIHRSQYRQRPTSYIALGIEAYLVLHNAMNRCQKPGDRLCINKMLRNTENYEGLVGKISILENGKAKRPLIVNTIRDASAKFVVKVH